MADLQCPNCGKNNPDFLDNCQFCQTPLRSEAMVHTGEKPVKKNTGELEPILPQWLQDVRQQGREAAEAEAEEEAAKPKVQKNEPPDLLAGLTSQAENDEEEVPDWLASIRPAAKPAAPPASEPEFDFFKQFQSESAAEAPPSQPPQADAPAWMTDATSAPASQAAEEKDELSEWFAQASAEPSAPVEMEAGLPTWTSSSEASSAPFIEEQPAQQPKEAEDLGWLHSLEESAKGDTSAAPQQNASQPDSIDDWLKNLGGAPTELPLELPTADEPPSWVGQLDNEQASAQAPAQEAAQSEPAAPQEDMSWLDQLTGGETASAEAKPAESPLWLQNIEDQQGIESASEKVSPFTRRTGPLKDVADDIMPDWLKSATEEPSMPAPGALSDWFSEADLAPHSPVTPDSEPSNVPASSSADVDALFAADMPDWLSHPEQGANEPPSEIASGDSLAPVDLPAWVQAMRPASEPQAASVPARKEQFTEDRGPLAGLEGVIPVAPIGSSRRPKAASLKLQPTDEQFAGAALLEKILASETEPRPISRQTNIASQNALRWAISALFLIALSAMAYLRTESMPVSAVLPPELNSLSSAIARLPRNPLVLVVMDYEPSLSGEMEAVSGPLLDQLVLNTNARFAFVSTSPNSTALVRRLLANTGIGLPAPEGLGYQPGLNYVNLGYLPSGFTGVRAFLESPTTVLPQAGLVADFSVTKFTDYAAVVVLTDDAESGRVWVEQLYARNRADATFFSVQPVFFAASAQAGPMLQPYYSSKQIAGLVSGLTNAARYEFVNNTRPGIARRYWDSFGAGMLLAVTLIVLGSLWSLVASLRARRSAEEAG
ncbi:MAG: hypothetical protein IT314_15015 [Anaerolineales bacterium]|nr:hypothetical protein [Anaerolineales bacterium]